MGQALYFNEEARAARIAQALAREGFGTLWRPRDKPQVVMTAASKAEVDKIVKANKGVVDNWWKLAEIDVPSTNMED